MQNFRALCLRRLGALPPNPKPPAAGGFASRPPLASGGWGLRPQTPKTAPPHCEFLATRLIAGMVQLQQQYAGNMEVFGHDLRLCSG